MAFKDTVKEWFKTGLKPTQAQFYSKFDFLRWKDEKIPITDIDDIENILAEKADAEVLENHLTDAGAHADLFNAKEDKNQKGVAGGYAPLDELNKLAVQYLNIVNDLVTGGSDSLLSAEQGTVLQTQIDAINTLLTSDDINLDTVQELVDAIKTVETSLETILMNDLTTGGTTKALTAEMGKTLKGLIDALTTALNNGLALAPKDSDIIHKTLNETKTGTLSLITPNVASGTSNLNAIAPIIVTGGNGGNNTNTTGTVSAGNAREIKIKAGNGGNVFEVAGTGLSGYGGDITLLAGDGGIATGTGTIVPGRGGAAILQAGTSYSYPGSAQIKAGNNSSPLGRGGNVYLTAGWGNNESLNNDLYNGSIFIGASGSNVVRGNAVIGSVDDDRIHKLQVTGPSIFNGTVKANPGSLSNEVVVKSQLDLKADDSEVVHKIGNEAISGIKTFNDDIVVNYKSLKITGDDSQGDSQEVSFGINSEGNIEWSVTDINTDKVTLNFNVNDGLNFNKKANFLGTVKAFPATLSNEVVVKSQLDTAVTSGSYTPIYAVDTNVTSVSGTTAKYSKIGKLVTVYFRCTVNTIVAGNTSAFNISLPFAIEALGGGVFPLINCFSVTGPTMSTGFSPYAGGSNVNLTIKHPNNTEVVVLGQITYIT